MSKILKFTQFSVRDLIVAAAPTLLLIVGACLLAYWLVDPAPPRTVRLATGQENSAYETFGKRYAQELKRDDIAVTLQPTLGSQENLERLRRGEADLAFVQSDGTVIPVGGKTGTGDQRFDVYGGGGRLIESRYVNRSATFVFNIGERFFGSMTAYVHGPESKNYDFTSALPVQLLVVLAPSLMPLIEPHPVAKPGATPPVMAQACGG